MKTFRQLLNELSPISTANYIAQSSIKGRPVDPRAIERLRTSATDYDTYSDYAGDRKSHHLSKSIENDRLAKNAPHHAVESARTANVAHREAYEAWGAVYAHGEGNSKEHTKKRLELTSAATEASRRAHLAQKEFEKTSGSWW